MDWLRWFLTGLLAAPAFGCGDTDGFDTRNLDLRDFERFRIEQTAALTPYGCPTMDLVQHARIRRTANGAYELTHSMPYSEDAYWQCRSEATDPEVCEAGIPGAPRRLEASDLDELMTLFSSVSVNFAPNPCRGLGDDPCNIRRFEWDELAASDQSCRQSKPWVRTSFATSVLEAVTGLTSPASAQ